MSNTPSNMLPLGTKAPDFNLLDTVSDQIVSLNQIKGTIGTVVMFICNHCPFVKHLNSEISNMAKMFQTKGISFIAISSNDAENYPLDAPHLMKQLAKEEGFTFPYLYDKTQQTAKDYDAACTPDFYLFNADLKLAYRGQLDSSRPGNNIPVTGIDLKNAMKALLSGQLVNANQKPSIGCNIKWADNRL